ncbi:MAG: Na-Ca exchanger/integrin-beta4 [Actinomycetia bacterium]|nr:Na-Ca exchanger/integrin-beta4 [Actinomycetes bacterium]
MNESGYGPSTRRRAGVAVSALLGLFLALIPFTPANAAPVPPITVTAPNGGETLVAGATTNVTWTGGSGNVRIELYKNSVFAGTVKSSIPASVGTYSWTIPMATVQNAQYRVKVIAISDTTVNDLSGADFTINAPVLAVTAPNGGESWLVGTTHPITWTTSATGNVRIELLKGGVVKGVIKAPIAASVHTFNWAIPMGTTVGTDYTVRITSMSNGLTIDVSDADFAITAPTIAVGAQAGTPWIAGTTHNVTWTPAGSGNVRIDLMDAGGTSLVKTIRPSIAVSAGTTGFAWDIPLGLATANGTYTIKVTSTVQLVTTGTSPSFAINLPTVGVIQPNGGESWAAGSSHAITWSAIGGNVRIDLLKNGTFNSTIKASVAGAGGTYTWPIPQGLAAGTQYRVRVVSLSNGVILDTSNADFTITLPTPTMATPSTSVAGSNASLTWTHGGTIGNVRLDLVQNGAVVRSIKASVAVSAQAYTWAIPLNVATASGSYLVRITSLANPAITDDSSSFTINLPSIAVTSPTATPTWTVGTSHAVTWTAAGVPGAVSIRLYNGGTLLSVIKSSTSAATGSFTWSIPMSLPAGTFQVKVESLTNSTVAGTANVTLALPVPTVSTPATSIAGTNLGLVWAANGTAGSVRVDLILASNSTLVAPIKTSISAAANAYSWDIPISIATAGGLNYKVRVTSITNSAVTGVSGAFTINAPTLTVTSPNGGESWVRGSTHNITWTTQMTVGYVKIDLYLNGVLVKNIKASVQASSGTFTWVLPANLAAGTTYTIRISAVGNASVTDVSNANFTVT